MEAISSKIAEAAAKLLLRCCNFSINNSKALSICKHRKSRGKIETEN